MSGPFGHVPGFPNWISDGPFGIWRHTSGKLRVVNVEPGYMIEGDTVEYATLGEAFEAAERVLSPRTEDV